MQQVFITCIGWMAVSERDQSWMGGIWVWSVMNGGIWARSVMNGGIWVWSVVWYRRYVIYRQMRTHKFSGDSMELLRLPFLLITPFKSMLATIKDQIFIEKLYILTQYLYRLHLDSKYMSWSWSVDGLTTTWAFIERCTPQAFDRWTLISPCLPRGYVFSGIVTM